MQPAYPKIVKLLTTDQKVGGSNPSWRAFRLKAVIVEMAAFNFPPVSRVARADSGQVHTEVHTTGFAAATDSGHKKSGPPSPVKERVGLCLSAKSNCWRLHGVARGISAWSRGGDCYRRVRLQASG